tara:strand:+ start:419 stop:898 length:480 start_codon:yes stop_codon:yes gene_type:complete
VLFLALALAINLKKEDGLTPVNSQTYFPISIDGHELQLQLALSPSEKKKGLMHRESLAEDHGMLFLFDYPDQASFWMRNTRIPLDIAYFDASGRLKEVHPLYPFDETSVMSRCREILIAIETNQEWFAQKSIRAGALIDMAALNAALSRRNYISQAIVP